MTVRRLVQKVAVAAICVAATSLATAGSASGTVQSDGKPQPPPAPTSPTGQALLDIMAQQNVDSVADKLQSFIQLHHLTASSSDITVDIAHQEVTVWWVGTIPENVVTYGRDLPLTVLFRPAKFSLVKQQYAANAIVSAFGPSDSSNRNWYVTSAELSPSGSPIKVSVHTESGTTSASRGQITDLIVAKSGSVGAIVDTFNSSGSLTFGRQDDIYPWYGGARIWNSARRPFEACSSGFVLQFSSGGVRQLSAGHCLAPGEAAFFTIYYPSTDTLGGHRWTDGPAQISFANQSFRLDSMLASTTTEQAAGRIYTGPYNGTSSVPVRGQSITRLGDRICSSGATSGSHCDLSVTARRSYPDGLGGSADAFIASSPSIGLAVAGGDSGGSVYVERTTGGVTARGIVGAGDTQITCSSNLDPKVGHVCYHQILFVPIDRLLNYWGGVVRLG